MLGAHQALGLGGQLIHQVSEIRAA